MYFYVLREARGTYQLALRIFGSTRIMNGGHFCTAESIIQNLSDRSGDVNILQICAGVKRGLSNRFHRGRKNQRAETALLERGGFNVGQFVRKGNACELGTSGESGGFYRCDAALNCKAGQPCAVGKRIIRNGLNFSRDGDVFQP